MITNGFAHGYLLEYIGKTAQLVPAIGAIGGGALGAAGGFGVARKLKKNKTLGALLGAGLGAGAGAGLAAVLSVLVNNQDKRQQDLDAGIPKSKLPKFSKKDWKELLDRALAHEKYLGALEQQPLAFKEDVRRNKARAEAFPEEYVYKKHRLYSRQPAETALNEALHVKVPQGKNQSLASEVILGSPADLWEQTMGRAGHSRLRLPGSSTTYGQQSLSER
jgi:hypothetical protein